ncbi:putative membrane protein [Candidatus Ichthyocystis hellenicum]|uniref:Putative membrane protein n=1 Tax=Candidatus Ichthyocystis hellenicum TaxID=1561003 RepID=A0A0S4M3X8_9BURK|nr:putative membrane protein [Candidatus Ichthyocystis hellenicum]
MYKCLFIFYYIKSIINVFLVAGVCYYFSIASDVVF